MAIENTAQYQGVYHVLGGKISPIEGIGPSELTIQELIDFVETQDKQVLGHKILKYDETNAQFPNVNKGDYKDLVIISKVATIGTDILLEKITKLQ